MKKLIDKLYNKSYLNKDELIQLLNNINDNDKMYLTEIADKKRKEIYGDSVYLRGLIEFSSYCKNNCTYCGLRASNTNAERYRLSNNEILSACNNGYSLGYRTFVLQGGEDNYYTDDKIVYIVNMIKDKYPDCAVTLSIGEKPKESYKKYFDAGADRYLLRHETATKNLYNKLHPNMSFENRIRCLYDLKDIGYQVGSGFMVGLPNQTNKDFVNDLLFLKELEPEMVGIGPFIPHKDTALSHSPPGTTFMVTTLLSIIRLLLPTVLLPATTALGTIDPLGREKGIKAGANVAMPNLSPIEVRSKYSLYDGKICTGDESAQCRKCIENRINRAGYKVDMSRGDHITRQNKYKNEGT